VYPQIDQAIFPFKNVSITGGTGTVGSQFIKVLLAQFPSVEKVNTTCRNPGGVKARRIPASPRVNVIYGGIDERRVLDEIVSQGEIVYHLAAWLANTDMPDMTTIYVTNGLVPAVLAQFCAAKKKRLIFTSSHSVYFAGPYEGRIEEDRFPFRRDFVDWIAAVKSEYYGLAGAIVAGKIDFAAAPASIDAIHGKLPPPFDPKIYDNDAYHIYCLTKLLAERFVLDHGGVVLRLSNVYGPGDESTQAVAEACHRILAADPAVETKINQPFKKLVPTYLGDIIKALIRAGTLHLPDDVSPVFTVASQEHYLREDALLRAVTVGLNRICGIDRRYQIEQLPPEEKAAFAYDLGKMKRYVLYGEELTPFEEGVRSQLTWLMERAKKKSPEAADVTIEFAQPESG
jgi:nucleoside-diphosphate-sugar epimerase